MPGGLSVPKYIAFLGSSLLSMSFGSQIVHNIYRPLDDLDDYIEKYRKHQDELFSAASEKERLKLQINESKQTADWKLN